jgi:hypothetical protein
MTRFIAGCVIGTVLGALIGGLPLLGQGLDARHLLAYGGLGGVFAYMDLVFGAGAGFVTGAVAGAHSARSPNRSILPAGSPLLLAMVFVLAVVLLNVAALLLLKFV